MSEKKKYTRRMHDKWMQAMKSGKYKFGKYYFEVETTQNAERGGDIGSQCALGVLCSINNAPTMYNVYNASSTLASVRMSNYPFIDQFMGSNVYTKIFKVNDNSNNTDYPVKEISKILCEAFPHLKKKSNESKA